MKVAKLPFPFLTRIMAFTILVKKALFELLKKNSD